MAASLLRRGTYNSQDIKFELEATRAVYEASQSVIGFAQLSAALSGGAVRPLTLEICVCSGPNPLLSMILDE